MPSLKELNSKISSLRNTQKMTKTMKLVSASKMRRAMTAQSNAKVYGEEMSALLGNVAARVGASASHPLLTVRPVVRRIHAIVVMSDRGLCAGFNNNLSRFTARWLDDQRKKYESVQMSFCGRRGYSFFRSRCDVVKHYEGVTEKPAYATASAIAEELMLQYTSGQFDAIYLIFNRFKSALSQIPTVVQILPIASNEAAGATSGKSSIKGDMIFEPAEADLMGLLLPQAIRFGVFSALLENAAGEHAARMTAMESASKNATEMIERYTLERNRARQAAITKELIEIVTGAESL